MNIVKICADRHCKKQVGTIKLHLCDYHANLTFCKVNGCTKTRKLQGMCIAHSTFRKCDKEECNNRAFRKYCKEHTLGYRRICLYENCTSQGFQGGLCRKHGGLRQCSLKHCSIHTYLGGFCHRHYIEATGGHCVVKECNEKAFRKSIYCAQHKPHETKPLPRKNGFSTFLSSTKKSSRLQKKSTKPSLTTIEVLDDPRVVLSPKNNSTRNEDVVDTKLGTTRVVKKKHQKEDLLRIPNAEKSIQSLTFCFSKEKHSPNKELPNVVSHDSHTYSEDNNELQDALNVKRRKTKKIASEGPSVKIFGVRSKLRQRRKCQTGPYFTCPDYNQDESLITSNTHNSLNKKQQQQQRIQNSKLQRIQKQHQEQNDIQMSPVIENEIPQNTIPSSETIGLPEITQLQQKQQDDHDTTLSDATTQQQQKSTTQDEKNIDSSSRKEKSSKKSKVSSKRRRRRRPGSIDEGKRLPTSFSNDGESSSSSMTHLSDLIENPLSLDSTKFVNPVIERHPANCSIHSDEAKCPQVVQKIACTKENIIELRKRSHSPNRSCTEDTNPNLSTLKCVNVYCYGKNVMNCPYCRLVSKE